MSFTANKLIAIAEAEVGYLEKKTNSQLDSKTANAGGNNYTKYARDLNKAGYYNGNKNGFAWCDVFVDWCFYQLCDKNATQAQQIIYQTGTLGAGCSYSAGYYRKAERFYSTPKVGDQIFFGSVGKEKHTGIVYKVDSEKVYTIEGNTREENGVIPNGGGVFKKEYSLSDPEITGYGRPKYDAEPIPAICTVKEWQLAAIADGFEFPKYGADGKWGAECESVAKKAVVKKRLIYTNKNLTRIVQKAVGVTVDGKFGNNTKNAVIAYQNEHGLVADGEVGINTWKKLLGV